MLQCCKALAESCTCRPQQLEALPHPIAMPPTTRLRTVEFRSLLLPPIRVRLRTLYSFARPQCAPVVLHRAAPSATCPVQRRSLHLYKTAKAKTALGMHKVLDFDLYEPEPPSASSHRVNLVRSDRDPRVMAEDLSLQELYDEHISPGEFLYMAEPISKKLSENYEKMRQVNLASQQNNYAIVKARTVANVDVKHAQTELKQLGALKGVHLLLSNPVSYTKEALDRAYQFIESGSPVEFRIRLLGSVMKKKKSKGQAPNAGAWPWMHEHFPHLRPDFIHKSMPEGTVFIIKPISDGRCVQFVLGREAEQMPRLNLTKRLLRVKHAVKASIDNNPMAQRWQVKKAKVQGGSDEDVHPAKEGEQSVQDETRLEEARLEQLVDDSEQGTKGTKGRLELDEHGRRFGPARAIRNEAVAKLAAMKRETRNWRGQHDKASGFDRRGVWDKDRDNDKTNTHPSKAKLRKQKQWQQKQQSGESPSGAE